MKKWFSALLVFGISLSLCACGGSGSPREGSFPGVVPQSITPGSETPEVPGGSGGSEIGRNKTAEGGLTLLYHMQGQNTACCTENGYYYLTLEEERLTDGRHARHLMYMDFATRQEIYLCSDASCTHDTADCASVFPSDEFSYSTALFVWHDSLYILSKEQDRDGSAVVGILGESSGPAVEASPTALYRAGLDGTDREKVYAFDADLTVEDLVLGDESGLYFVTKKVTTQQSDGSTYLTSSERKLVRLDPSSGKETPLLSLNLGNDVDWDIMACTGRKLVLFGIDFGRQVSAEERHADDRTLYDTASDVFMTLNVDTGAYSEIYHVYAPKSRSYAADQDHLYYSVDGDGRITSVDLVTGVQKTLCEISQDAIWGMAGGRLYTRDGSDQTLYFIDTDTGEISHCGLVEKSTGFSLQIIASAGDQVLVIYDSDVTPKSDGSFTVHGYRYALISREDLFHGRDGFLPIQMIGSGR